MRKHLEDLAKNRGNSEDKIGSLVPEVQLPESDALRGQLQTTGDQAMDANDTIQRQLWAAETKKATLQGTITDLASKLADGEKECTEEG
jgi:hypothetical protein